MISWEQNYCLVLSLWIITAPCGSLFVRSQADPNITRVVGSHADVECVYNSSIDLETVRWTSTSPNELSLILFVKDGEMEPANHDPRFTISQDGTLIISNLTKEDAGKYTCTIISHTPIVIPSYVVDLNVIDGCKMWPIKQPLYADGAGCNSGDIIVYGVECTFSCAVYYTLNGLNSTYCLSNGTMSGTLPSCQAGGCSVDLLAPQLKDVGGNCTNGSMVDFARTCHLSCEDGYELDGKTDITCLPNQTFDNEFPTCIHVEPTSNISLLWLCTLFVLPLMFVAGVVLYFKGRRKRTPADNKHVNLQEINVESYTDFPREEDMETTNSVRNAENDSLLSGEQSQTEPPSFEGSFPHLLVNQLRHIRRERKGKTKLNILNRVWAYEKAVLQNVDSSDLPENMCPENPSSDQTFAWYVHLLLSWLPEAEQERARKEVVAATSSRTFDGRTFSLEPELTEGNTMINNTNIHDCAIINKALISLVVAHRKELVGETKGKKSAEIISSLIAFEEGSPILVDECNIGQDSSGKSSQDNTKKSSEEEKARSNQYFGQMCDSTLNQCSTLNGILQLHKTVLSILFS